MDTLSRKHRLRQQQKQQEQQIQIQIQQSAPKRNNHHHYQQQQQQQQQQAVYDEAHVLSQEDHRKKRYSSSSGNSSSASTSQYNGNGYYKNHNNREQIDDDDDENDFKVYQVSHVASATLSSTAALSSSQKLQRSNCDQRRGEKLNDLPLRAMNNHHPAYLSRDNQTIVCDKDARLMAKSSKQRQHHNYQTTNDYQTGDSSGFQSSGYSDSLHSYNIPNRNQTGLQSIESNQQQRSMLLDELDRLQLFKRSAQVSPTESNYTNSTLNRTMNRVDSTLIRGRERDFSVQCHEEFSNFIPAQNSNESHRIVAGPTLIGVHQSERNQYGNISPATASDPDQNESDCAIRISPTAGSHSEYHSLRVDWDLEPLKKYEDFSEKVDIFMRKLDCMLRLADGQYVSLDEAHHAFEEEMIDLGDEEPTDIEIVPLNGFERRIEILQEYQISEEICDENTYKNEKLAISQTVVSGREVELDDVPAHPCDCIELDWTNTVAPKIEEIIAEEEFRVRKDHALIEESLLNNLIGLKYADDTRGQRRVDLVSTVKGHLSEFLENYLNYQAEFKRQTTFATGWRDNWLFASRWSSPGDNLDHCRKRTKLDSDLTCGENETSDLVKYSTLTLLKYKPIKLTYLDCYYLRDKCRDLEETYEAQEDFSTELQAKSLDSVGQVDVCRLLLKMSPETDDEEEEDSTVRSARNVEKSTRLKVNYCSSLAVNCNQRPTSFTAYGYLFELPSTRYFDNNVSYNSRAVSRLKTRLLDKFTDLIAGKPEKPIAAPSADRVRFLVNLADVSLANKLPVIQFCAKFTGALPISVKWFREVDEKSAGQMEEMSDISDLKRRQNLRLHQRSCSDSFSTSWPVAMHANYDYEYQTNWSSWYRFKRSKGDIMFELRNADETRDHNTTYKCLIQNYCSRQECEFKLTRRKPPRLTKARRKSRDESKSSGLTTRAIAGGGCAEKDKHALLRSWSQRTLHRPAPTVVNGDNGSAEITSAAKLQEPPQNSTCEKAQQVLGNINSSCKNHLTCNDDSTVRSKFGQDFPYHPVNLLKRLKENKYLVIHPQQQQQQKKANSKSSGLAARENFSTTASMQREEDTTSWLAGKNYNDMPISESMDSFEPIEVELPPPVETAEYPSCKNDLDENENEQHCNGYHQQKSSKARDLMQEDDQAQTDGQRPKSSYGSQSQDPMVPKPRQRSNAKVSSIKELRSDRQEHESNNHRAADNTSDINAIKIDPVATGVKASIGGTNGYGLASAPQVKSSQVQLNTGTNNNDEECVSKPNVKSLISRFSIA